MSHLYRQESFLSFIKQDYASFLPVSSRIHENKSGRKWVNQTAGTATFSGVTAVCSESARPE